MRITARTRRAGTPAHADLYGRIITAVVEDGSWQWLLPIPVDGLLLVPSRSVEYADHEVFLRGRAVIRCTGPCGAHPTCWHRVACALASWSTEHPGWDINAVRDPESGRLHPGLIHSLISAYLTPAPERRRIGPGADRDELPERSYGGDEEMEGIGA